MRLLCFIIALITSILSHAQTPSDSVQRNGFSISINPCVQIAMDRRIKKIMDNASAFSMTADWNHVTLPSDSDAYAADFAYPTFSASLRYTFNDNVRMHRYSDPEWGLLLPVDYDSPLGNTLSAYATFSRPFSRNKHWETDYSLSIGLGYSHMKYNTHNDIDNELIGAHLLIYFGAGLHLTWHPVPEWGIRAGLDFFHHSNGALHRPNKGSNTFGPSLAVVYTPYYETLSSTRTQRQPFTEKKWFMNFSVGAGAKALHEDWIITQFYTDPEAPDYRTSHFKLYAAYSLQADVMRRYARRWASGAGLDLFYGTYYKRSKEIDKFYGHKESTYSPVSIGFALKHNVYYRNWSANMALGFYLYRHMGKEMRSNETPYYERIGIHYHIPKLNGLTIGANVHAHLGKANFTEFVIGMPVDI